ncbi:MAG: heme-binding domain-containing protein [Moheibacter sp.]
MKQRPKWKMIALSVLGVLVIIQFYQPGSYVYHGRVQATDFIKVYNSPKAVSKILENSCYNCHSNNTKYEWFDYIQPGRMFIELHITNGKQYLNFSEWSNYYSGKQERLLQSIVTQVEKNEMPLPSYLWLHPEARLTKDEKQALINWIKDKK